MDEFLTFSSWYHYVLLLLWLILLILGIKYFGLLEEKFKPREGFTNGKKYGASLLTGSFILGLLLFLIQVFTPEQQVEGRFSTDNIISYAVYALFVALLLINIFQGITYYEGKSRIARICMLCFLMCIYFYSGALGGLIVAGVLALIVLIYFLVKFKNILSIK